MHIFVVFYLFHYVIIFINIVRYIINDKDAIFVSLTFGL